MAKYIYTFGMVAIVLQLLVSCSQAYPETRSIKGHRLNMRGALNELESNSIDNNNEVSDVQVRVRPSCYESIPCGWAHYTTSSNRFRPIYHYTKNTMCSCQGGQRCVLTDNRLDRKAYIFQCRNSEASRHMYPFPELT